MVNCLQILSRFILEDILEASCELFDIIIVLLCKILFYVYFYSHCAEVCASAAVDRDQNFVPARTRIEMKSWLGPRLAST